jgi:L-alanine-DL-glutamate epimerase-like enolase superfamily enzyme
VRPVLHIAGAALKAGAGCVVTTSIEAGPGTAACLHIAAAVGAGRAHGLATLDLLESSLILPGVLAVEHGCMAPPSGLGLGIALDGAALERYCASWQEVA